MYLGNLLAATADPGVYTMSPGRIGAMVAALVALIGVASGVLALARSAGRIGAVFGTRGPIVALVSGLIGMVTGGLVVVTAEGGLGTGNGLGGGAVALLLGLISVVLGGLALARARRTSGRSAATSWSADPSVSSGASVRPGESARGAGPGAATP